MAGKQGLANTLGRFFLCLHTRGLSGGSESLLDPGLVVGGRFEKFVE